MSLREVNVKKKGGWCCYQVNLTKVEGRSPTNVGNLGTDYTLYSTVYSLQSLHSTERDETTCGKTMEWSRVARGLPGFWVGGRDKYNTHTGRETCMYNYVGSCCWMMRERKRASTDGFYGG